MATPMHFEVQEAYEWPVAVYLFLGGLGGALISLGFVFSFFQAAKDLAGFSILGGVVFFALAGMFLIFFDLERPINAIYSLNNVARSGISWDVVLIALSVGFGILFAVPFYGEYLGSLSQMLAPFQTFFGALAFIAGFLFPIISGGLLAGLAAVPLWNTPALPIIFLITSFELALAMVGAVYPLDHQVYLVTIGALFALSLVNLGLTLAYLEHGHNGAIEAKKGMHRMLKSPLFVLVYLGGTVIFPLGLSAYLFFTGATLSWALPALAIVLLVGGYLVRNSVIHNGIHVYPWPY